jgi:hypothetical protein
MRAVLLAGAALLWCGAAHASCGTDPTPAPALAYGLTCEVFVDNMTSSATIDTANTLAPGFHWYINNWWPNAVQAGWTVTGHPVTTSGDWNISAGGLQMAPTNGGINYGGSMFNTCVQAPTAPFWTGTAFTGSFYMDVTYTTNSQQDVSFWLNPVEFFVSTATRTEEIDNFESQFVKMLHDWTNWSGGTSPSINYSATNGGSVNGVLLVAPSLNGGVGLLKRAVNDVVNDTLQYSATMVPIANGVSTGLASGSFSPLPTQHYCILLTGDKYDGVLTVQKVAVWQAPTGVASGGRRSLFR